MEKTMAILTMIVICIYIAALLYHVRTIYADARAEKKAKAKLEKKVKAITWPDPDLPPINLWSVPKMTAHQQTLEQATPDAGAHYRKMWRGMQLDPFRIASIFDITDFAQMTILKKILCVGQRGYKDEIQDYKDIICAAERKIEMLREDNFKDEEEECRV